MSVLSGRPKDHWLFTYQIFDVIIIKSDYDIKNLIMMREFEGFWPTLTGHVDRVMILSTYPFLEKPFFGENMGF